MAISLSNKPGHMAKSVCRIRRKCKIWCFFWMSLLLLWHYFSAKTVYL